ncbi:hypothetical protein WJX81_000560 [Elliptochloris bilobata]|uniref:Histone deacetylase domain-containing protein n=1 Tax=Elliptochloris bilobata TaxID=381761 RepID=A0AAW1QY54_9CHLO
MASESLFKACGRPAAVPGVRKGCADLGAWTTAGQLPLVYSETYNIRCLGLERFHPFDSTKFVKVVQGLLDEGLVSRNQFVEPREASRETLLDVHTPKYLEWLHGSKCKVATVLEMQPIVVLPNWLIQRLFVRPARFHAAGTMLAAALAVEHGWAINVGGGQHHAYWEDASDGGWCLYSDLTLALRRVRKASGGAVQKVMIIDLDVHQGNGHERDKLHFQDADTFILDAYNSDIWPADSKAKAAIGVEMAFPCRTADETYLPALADALKRALQHFAPDLILYNAGTDILDGDPLGSCSVSAGGVVARDEMVFNAALSRRVPIAMALSGGYARDGHRVITQSIANLLRVFRLGTMIRTMARGTDVHALEGDEGLELPSVREDLRRFFLPQLYAAPAEEKEKKEKEEPAAHEALPNIEDPAAAAQPAPVTDAAEHKPEVFAKQVTAAAASEPAPVQRAADMLNKVAPAGKDAAPAPAKGKWWTRSPSEPRSRKEATAPAKPPQRFSFANSKRVAAAPMPASALPLGESREAKPTVDASPAPAAELALEARAAPAEAADAAATDPTPAVEPADAEAVVAPGQSAPAEGAIDVAAKGHMAETEHEAMVTVAETPTDEGPAAGVAAEVEAALAPAADPHPTTLPAADPVPAPPTAKPAADEPVAGKQPAAAVAAGAGVMGNALPAVPEADEAAVQADTPAAAPAVENEAADKPHGAAVVDAKAHEAAPANVKSGAVHEEGHVDTEERDGAAAEQDAAPEAEGGGAGILDPNPGFEPAAEEYNTASEGGDMDAAVADAHAHAPAANGAETEAIKEEAMGEEGVPAVKGTAAPAPEALKAALPPPEPLVWRKPGSKPGVTKRRSCLSALLPCLRPATA